MAVAAEVVVVRHHVGAVDAGPARRGGGSPRRGRPARRSGDPGCPASPSSRSRGSRGSPTSVTPRARHRRLELGGPDLGEPAVVLRRVELRHDDLAELAAGAGDEDDAVAGGDGLRHHAARSRSSRRRDGRGRSSGCGGPRESGTQSWADRTPTIGLVGHDRPRWGIMAATGGAARDCRQRPGEENDVDRAGPSRRIPRRRVATPGGRCVAFLALLAGLAPAPGARRRHPGPGRATRPASASPVAIANAGDGTGRLFVVEQAGRIRIITEGRHPPLDAVPRHPLARLVLRRARAAGHGVPPVLPHERPVLRLLHGQRRGPRRRRVPATQLEREPRLHHGAPDHPHPALRATPTTTAASSRSGPTGTSTSARATAAAAATRSRTASGARRSWARSCGSPRTSRRRARPTGFRRRTRGRRAPRSATRSGPTGCATRGASASTAGPATCGSPTSARTTYEEVNRSRRSAGGGRGANFGWDQYEAFRCHEGPCSSSGKTFPLAVLRPRRRTAAR